MKTIITTAFIVFGVYSLRAQATEHINLEGALSRAVANSKELRLSKTKLEAAEAKLAQAKDRVLPEVKVSGTYLRVNTPRVDFKESSDNNSNGGDSPLAAFSNLHQVALAQLSVSQPIFAGMKVHNTKIMQQYLKEAASYDTVTAKSKVLLNTSTALYEYYELLQTRRLIDENLKQAQQRVTEFKNLEAQGLLPRNDRLKAELQVINIELTRTEVDNNVAIAEFNLNLLLGFPEKTTIALDTTGMFIHPPVMTWEENLQQGISNRSELKSARLQIHAMEAGTRVAKASKYPSLGLSAGYVNAYLPNVLTVTSALNAGLSLQYNLTGIFHGKHLVEEAKAQQQAAETAQQITYDEIRTEIKKDYLNYQKSLEKIRLTQQAIEQAQENYTITQNKFNAGLVILSDYLDADVTLLQAQINFATAKAENMIAYYKLQESTGSIQ